MQLSEAFVKDCPGVPNQEEALAFSRLHDDDLATWWNESPQGNWMLWIAGLSLSDQSPVVLASCDCARLACQDAGVEAAVYESILMTAENWTRGKCTPEECLRAADRVGGLMDPYLECCDIRAARAVSATGMPCAAVGFSHDRSWFSSFAAQAAQRAAVSIGTEECGHARMAELVRSRIPRDLILAVPNHFRFHVSFERVASFSSHGSRG